MSSLSYLDIYEELMPSYLELDRESVPTGRQGEALEKHFSNLIAIAADMEDEIKQAFSKKALRTSQKEELQKYYHRVLSVAEQMLQKSQIIFLGGAIRLAAFVASRDEDPKRCEKIFDKFKGAVEGTLESLDDECGEARRKLGENPSLDDCMANKEFAEAYERNMQTHHAYTQNVACAAALLPEEKNSSNKKSNISKRLHDWAVDVLEDDVAYSFENYQNTMFQLMSLAEEPQLYPGAEIVLREAYDRRVLFIGHEVESTINPDNADEMYTMLQIQLTFDASMISSLFGRRDIGERATAAFCNHAEALHIIDPEGTPNFLRDVLKKVLEPGYKQGGYDQGEAKLVALIESRLYDAATSSLNRSNAPLFAQPANRLTGPEQT